MVNIDKITELLKPVVEGLNYQFVGVELLSQDGQPLLRIYIDTDNGVTVDDCATVSHQISRVLDVEEVIRSEYHLEISSPGLNRRLFNIEQCQFYIGEMVKLKLFQATPLSNQKNFKARLIGVNDDQVVITSDGEEYEFSFDEIEKLNLSVRL